ncbi:MULTISPECIES: hypothetical protein [Kitasatospora]|uniref:Putative integral membrane protein n=1 Tax=Kitasatospora setae (strain ATCC 33774 / DSM 43861 / JCM 3304 / KCC A-0304 / NBRC 14216 / KM-6054) TaxID=452652 RepID=E4N6B1_KITSK|nr:MULTISPECIES: hypothetical protein [Kitasatospora]BAJ26742.1 putative integral membrane protein [Kitasatospora setae KM-6054]
MDQANAFESPTTMRLHRAEYLAAFAVSVGLFVAHADRVRWLPAVLLFVYIDVIGYLPGAVAYRRTPGGRISKNYYRAYNLMHSALTQGLVAGVWIWAWGAEWALLAIPIHLCADRGIFGNFLKPLALPFEPVPDQRFAELTARLFPRGTRGGNPARTPESAT